MATISDKKIKLIKYLYYQKKFSARIIAKELGVSIDAVYSFMRRNKLPRRSLKEENLLRFERKALSFFIKNKLSLRDRELKMLGVALYWAEGYKGKKSCGVDFTNSDPIMIELFLRFLREICGINETRLRVLIYCYANQNIKKLIRFWNKITKIPKSQFSKPYIRKDFKLEKINKMLFGLIHIRYMDKKLLIKIKQWIEEYKNKFAQVVP